jgi:hypothetical protein
MSKKKNKNNTEMIQLGSFECTSGKFVVSDPCYTLGTWCQGILENVKKGTWNAAILVSDEDDFGKRVSRLYAKHDSLNTEFPDLEPCWSECNFDVGVDSGQVGIYEYETYRNDSVIDFVPRNTIYTDRSPGHRWMAANCGQTIGKFAGTIPGGVVSQSGYGDGVYSAFVVKDNSSMIIAVMVEFFSA